EMIQINDDGMEEHQPPPYLRRSGKRLVSLLIAISALLLACDACGNKSNSNISNAANENKEKSSSGPDAASIIERHRALDNSRDSITRMRARISGSSSEELAAPRQIQLTIYRKHEPDGRLVMLIEFTSPAEERDRDGLITAFPDHRIEGVRYVQS